MKVYRADEAAERLGIPPRVLEVLEDEGRIHAQERVNGISYYSQCEVDRLLTDLLGAVQRAYRHDLEVRLETAESRIEDLDREMKRLTEKKLTAL